MQIRESWRSVSLSAVASLTVGLLALSGCSTAWHTTEPSSNVSGLTITEPASQTVLAEQDATFTVTAQGGQNLSYQWYRNGDLISDATSASYTALRVPLSFSGSQYTAKVWDSQTVVTSKGATLTVDPLQPGLTFQPIPAIKFGEQPFPVLATSASTGRITYSILSGPATISDSVVTLTGIGNVVVGAVQAQSGNYAAATASVTFVVTSNVSISSVSPVDQTIAPGQQAFSATVIGGLTDAVRWTASAGSFIGNVWTSPNNAGTNTITATSVDDPTHASSTTVTVSAPVVIKQPVSQSICLNGAATLSVDALYGVTYLWSHNGAAINGASQPAYLISAADSSDAGTYAVSVSNPAGTASSNPVILSVGSQIMENPSNLSVSATETATFSVATTGDFPFHYQWYRVPPGGSNGAAIPGATSDSYTTPSVTLTNNGDEYYATVTDACGTLLTSSSATLTVVGGGGTPPTIIQQPAAQNTSPSGVVSFSVVASGTPTLSYQWYRLPAGSDVGILLTNATMSSYTVPVSATSIENDQDAYYVIVTNPYGEAASQQALLTVGAGITITKQPVSVYVNVGAAATFSATAVSMLPLAYQWFEAAPGSSNFAEIQGAIGPTLTLSTTGPDMSGSTLYVIVSNGVTASVKSQTVALLVGSVTGTDSCANWNVIGDAKYTGDCDFQLTQAVTWQSGAIVWPTLLATANIRLSFTVATSNSTPIPADGFAVVLGDPSAGATPSSQGLPGEGLGARGIPGLVIAFDDYEDIPAYGFIQDPLVPYLGVGRGEDNQWENPYWNVNTNIPALADPSGQTVSHEYVVLISDGQMSMTMDGKQVFSGSVDVPPVAYLYVTASTGVYWEQTVVSNISAVVSAPSH